jgi:chromosome segregation ATPase
MMRVLLACGFVASSVALANEESPVKRVVGLLEKMKAELQAEADKEAEMYDQMVCWCETNEKEKTLAIAQAEATIEDLQAEIEQRSARFGELGTEIEAMKKQIAEDTAALKEATGIREKDAGSFRDEEKASVQAITNLKNAIGVLGKHQGLERGLKDPKGASLAQIPSSEVLGLRVVLADIADKHEMLMTRKDTSAISLLAVGSSSVQASKGSLSKQLLDAMDDGTPPISLNIAERVLAKTAAADEKKASFLQGKQPMSQSYASQSDGIFGILTTMLDEFEADLASSQKSESTSASDFAALSAAKTEQISVGKEKLDELEGDNAANQKALSDAKENLQLTTDQRAADVEFLRNLKLTCNDLDAQWAARSKTRSDEIVAVAETITILTEDDNHDQLKAGGVALLSFLQVQDTSAMRAIRVKASTVLRQAAKDPDFDNDDLLAAWRGRAASKMQNPRAQLSTLAVSVQLDSFTKVKEMIDKLVAELKVQQQEEVDFKAYCTKELDGNEKGTFNKNEEKEDLETKLKQLAALIEKLTTEIAEANAQIAETQLEVKKASQSREDANAEFQTVVSDQRATQGILAKALQRLKDFYATRLSGRALLQVKQTPPVQFNTYKNNAGASPVMGLIEQIVEDSKALEKEAITGEYQAQADYEKMVKDSNKLVADLSDAVNAKTKATSQAQIDSSQANTDLDMANSELESLAAYEADLHHQCDFVLKNFDIRQKARLQEMEAISQAKAILSGSQ